MVRRLMLFLFGLLLCSCSSSTDSAGEAPGQLVESSKPRVTSPNVADGELEQLARGNGAFAWEFYRQATKPGENLFLSPYSISVALAMTWAGARGNTETEIAEGLSFTLDQARLHPAFNALDLELGTRAEAGGDDAPRPFRLNVTNALFAQLGATVIDPFLDTLAEHYGAGMRLMNFVDEAEESRIAINRWISDRTEQRIETLLPPGSINPMTRFVLVNTIYFTASWAEPFEEDATRNASFRRLDGSEVTVPTMHQIVTTGYAEGEGFEAAELPYDGHQLAMLLIVPDDGAFAEVEQTLTATSVEAIRSEMQFRTVELALPKFSFLSDVPSKAPLQALGVIDAFDGGRADFSGITGTRSLFIDTVLHQAFVAVDEAGTEAAAATAVLLRPVSAGPPPATLTIDRPFIFAIVDRPTGATLFVGRVLDPSS